jgi:hypothetical protein
MKFLQVFIINNWEFHEAFVVKIWNLHIVFVIKNFIKNVAKTLVFNFLLHVSNVVNFECVVLDPIIALQNLEITKQRKKTYELNKHFQGT